MRDDGGELTERGEAFTTEVRFLRLGERLVRSAELGDELGVGDRERDALGEIEPKSRVATGKWSTDVAKSESVP